MLLDFELDNVLCPPLLVILSCPYLLVATCSRVGIGCILSTGFSLARVPNKLRQSCLKHYRGGIHIREDRPWSETRTAFSWRRQRLF